MPVIPLFVSSTFRDFHRERDILVASVRPALDDLVRSFGCRVEIIDLRWGVAAADVDEDNDSRQGRVLDVCLHEIDRARPLFVGLVGDRYGWVPPRGRAIRAARAASLDVDVEGKSVTALEFEHGTVTNADTQGVFFIREFVGTPPAGFADPDPGPVAALRFRVMDLCASGSGAAHSYSLGVQGDGTIDYQPFERLAIEVLGAAVIDRARQIGIVAEDPHNVAERLFFEDRATTVAGRDDLIDDVVDAVRSGSSVCLLGPSGVGKSAVWCRAVEGLRRDGRVVVVPVGAATGLTSEQGVIGRLARQLDEAAPPDLDRDALGAWWRAVVARHQDVIVAVDGIDGLDVGEARERLRMLIGVSARVLTSTTDHTQASHLAQDGVRTVAVTPFAKQSVPEVVAALANQIRRILPAAAVSLLAREDRSPLWLALAVGELAALDEEDFVDVDVGADPIEELSRLVVATVGALPSDLSALLDRQIDRLEARFGRTDTLNVLSALTLSRSGLAPVDLGLIAQVDELTVAGIRHGFGGMIVERGTDRRLGFAHGAAKEAVEKRALHSRQYRIQLHHRIAWCLGNISDEDPLRKDDVLWHWMHVEDDPTAVAEVAGHINSQWILRYNGDGIRTGRVIGQAVAEGISLAAPIAQLLSDGVLYLAQALRERLIRGAPPEALPTVAQQVLTRARRLRPDPGIPRNRNHSPDLAVIESLRAAATVSDPATALELHGELVGLANEREAGYEGLGVVLADMARQIGGVEGRQMMRQALTEAERKVVGRVGKSARNGPTWLVDITAWSTLCVVLERSVLAGVEDADVTAERILRYCRTLAQVVRENRGLQRNLAGALAFAASRSGAEATTRRQEAMEIALRLLADDPGDDEARSLLSRIAHHDDGFDDSSGYLLEIQAWPYMYVDDDAAARTMWEESVAIARRLADDDPADSFAQARYAFRIRSLGRESDDHTAARCLLAALDALERALTIDSRDKLGRSELTELPYEFSRCSHATTEMHVRAAELSRRLLDDDPEWIGPHISLAERCAAFLLRNGAARDAAAHYCEVAELVAAAPDPHHLYGEDYRRKIIAALKAAAARLRWRDAKLLMRSVNAVAVLQ